MTDLRFRKVSNGVIGFGAAAGLAILTAEWLSGDGGAAEFVFTGHAGLGIWQWLSMCGGYVLRLGLVCAIGFPLFLFRMMGAGDVKLMAVIAAWLGWHDGAVVIGYGFFIGAIWALFNVSVRDLLSADFLFHCLFQAIIPNERENPVLSCKTGWGRSGDSICSMPV